MVLTLLSSLPYSAQSRSILVYEKTLYLLAVDEQGNGVVVETVFKIYKPGSGKIIVEPRDKVTDDVITSIKYAIVLSSVITGFNYELFDYRYEFKTNLKLEGLSATLGFTLGFLGFLRNTSAAGFASTGLVSPYGTVGLVSGIGAKYVAARGRGLSLVIGPVYGVNWTAYRGVLDVFTAFRIAYREPLLGGIGNVSFPDSNLGAPYRRIFNESSLELYGLINETLERLVDLGVDYTKSDGFKFLNYSLRHYFNGRYYTASSYAFRALYTLYRLYLNALRGLDYKEYSKVVLLEVDSISRDIQNLTMVIKQYSSSLKEINLWDLDALMNSYERLNIAWTLLVEFINSGYADTDSLALSKARVVTAKQWLKLFRSSLYESEHTIDISIIEKTKSSLKTFCLVSNDYLSKVFPGLGWEFLNCSTIDMEGLWGLIEFSQQLDDLTRVFESGVSKTIYEEYLGLNEVLDLVETMREVAWYLYVNTYRLTPSLITAIELSNSYIEDGENISVVAYTLVSNLPNTIIYMALVGSATNETWLTTTPITTPGTEENGGYGVKLMNRVPVAIVLLVSTVTMLMGLAIIVYVVFKSSRE